MFTNTKATLYNRYIDSNNDYQYNRVVLDSVHWESIRGRQQNPFGAELNDTVKVSIPFSVCVNEIFAKPVKYCSLSDKEGYFTFQPEDKIVKGVIPDTVAFEDLEASYDDVVTITYVETADYGSYNMQHWELTCK